MIGKYLRFALDLLVGVFVTIGGWNALMQVFGVTTSLNLTRGLFNDILLVVTFSTMIGALAAVGPIIVWEAIREFVDHTPKTVTLCGSVRFKEDFEIANERFTLEGWIVLQPGSYRHSLFHGIDREWLTKKEMLDRLHKQKILQSDLVFVINPDGYIGESTQSEIEFAEKKGIEIQYLEGD